MRHLFFVAGAILFALVALTTPRQSSGAAGAEATISIRADRIVGRANPLIFGANLEAGDPKGIFGDVSMPAATRTGSGIWDDDKGAPSGAANWARAAGVALWRFPGGCLAHNYAWKKTIGPLEKRGDFRFGVDEFLKLCAATRAAPLFTLPDYSGTPQDAADLVEYLNAPADARHPWAQQRAANGHPRPYRVKWFELGNESDHGNHALLPPRRFSPEQYAEYARLMAGAMKRVDPSVQVGIVTAGLTANDAWNPVVLAKCGAFADFVVVHHYAVSYQSDDPHVDEGKLMAATMASGEQFEHQLGEYRALIARYAGRPLPLALTEFNVGFVQQQPKPYRFSWGAALWSADYARVLLRPQNHVLMANYWQFVNGYWGQIQGGGERWTPRPAYAAFRLWTRFGPQLLETQTDAPTQPFDGFGSTMMARGPQFRAPQPLGPSTLLAAPLQSPAGAGFSTHSDPDGATALTLRDFKGLSYPTLANVEPPAATGPEGAGYHLSFKARWLPAKESGPIRLGLGLADARGWEQTHSAIAVMGAEDARGWQEFAGLFEALPDAPGVAVVARLEGGETGATGRLELRNIALRATSNTLFPSYALLTSTASLSDDGKSVRVMVFNKSADRDIVTAIRLGAFVPRQTRAWTLSAPSFTSLEVGANGVHEEFAALPNPQNGILLHTFPARSMTALEFRLTPAPNV